MRLLTNARKKNRIIKSLRSRMQEILNNETILSMQLEDERLLNESMREIYIKDIQKLRGVIASLKAEREHLLEFKRKYLAFVKNSRVR